MSGPYPSLYLLSPAVVPQVISTGLFVAFVIHSEVHTPETEQVPSALQPDCSQCGVQRSDSQSTVRCNPSIETAVPAHPESNKTQCTVA